MAAIATEASDLFDRKYWNRYLSNNIKNRTEFIAVEVEKDCIKNDWFTKASYVIL